MLGSKTFLRQSVEYEAGLVLVELGGRSSVCVVCGLGLFYWVFFSTKAFTLRKQFQSFISFLIEKKRPALDEQL